MVRRSWQSETPGPSRFVDEHEWKGTRDIAAYLSVPAAIQFMQAHDWPAVREVCHELVRHARREVGALTGREPISPDSLAWYAQMAAFPLPACDGELLRRRLYDEFRVEVPITAWNRGHLVRISVQGYNTPADVDARVESLGLLLPEVRD